MGLSPSSAPSERDRWDLPLPPQPIIAIRSTGHDLSERPTRGSLGNYRLVVGVLGPVHPKRTRLANGPACHAHSVTGQQVLTALFNVGIAISVGITVLSLGLSFTVR